MRYSELRSQNIFLHFNEECFRISQICCFPYVNNGAQYGTYGMKLIKYQLYVCNSNNYMIGPELIIFGKGYPLFLLFFFFFLFLLQYYFPSYYPSYSEGQLQPIFSFPNTSSPALCVQTFSSIFESWTGTFHGVSWSVKPNYAMLSFRKIFKRKYGPKVKPISQGKGIL